MSRDTHRLVEIVCDGDRWRAQSPAARRMYKRQLERTAARLKGGE